MEELLLKLLSDLCVNHGFCLSMEAQSEIVNKKTYNAKIFAFDVLKAEGMHPESEAQWVRQISREFVKRFGTTEISVSDFDN